MNDLSQPADSSSESTTFRDAGGVQVTPRIYIPPAELQWRFSRSSGPGGQNVNKVETRVELLFHLEESPSLGPAEKSRLLERLAGRVDAEGCLRVVSSEHRSQAANRAAALNDLANLLRDALRPRKIRRPTSIPRAVQEARLQAKRRRAAVKRSRSERPGTEE